MNPINRGSFFVRFRGRVSGPFSADRLRGMAHAGQLGPIHEVSPDRTTWTPASDVPGLLPAAPEPAQPAPAAPAAPRPAPAAAPDPWYYLAADGARAGPVSRRQLTDLYLKGHVGGGTSVWTKGMAEWVPLADAGLVEPAAPAPQPAYHPAPAPTPPPARGAGFGIAALVLGVLSLVSACLSVVPLAGLVFFGLQLVTGVLAVCFGAIGLRRGGRGMAVAGFVSGIVAVSLFLIMLVLVLIFVGSFALSGPIARLE